MKIKNKKKGAEMIETILMVGIIIAICLVVFYPSIMRFFEYATDSLETWYNNAINEIGIMP